MNPISRHRLETKPPNSMSTLPTTKQLKIIKRIFPGVLVVLQSISLASMILLEIPWHRTRTKYSDSYHVSIVWLWNSLQRDITEPPTLGSFKFSLVKYLKETNTT
uniref:Uncharacterized protein n=1 Tax=Cacopsylla melanoneura TaxID=428564 RepID=A0A8D9BTK0_9HEMI